MTLTVRTNDGARYSQREEESRLGFFMRVFHEAYPAEYDAWLVNDKDRGYTVPEALRVELESLIGTDRVAPWAGQSNRQLDKHITNLAVYINRLLEEQALAPTARRGKLIAKLSKKARRLTNQLSHRMAVAGYYDETYHDYHGSETQGTGVSDPDRDDAYWLSRLKVEDDYMILRRWSDPNWLDKSDPDYESNLIQYRWDQLDEVLTRFFGTHRWHAIQFVTEWREVGGKWKPAKKQYVELWIREQIRLYGELDGITRCLRSWERRLERSCTA